MAKGRKTGGRKVGTLNHATREIKEWARDLSGTTRDRIEQLIASEDENVALKAIIAVWNRAYGMPSQQMSLDGATLQVFAGIKIVIGGDKPDAGN